jgi:hypothetical protein
MQAKSLCVVIFCSRNCFVLILTVGQFSFPRSHLNNARSCLTRKLRIDRDTTTWKIQAEIWRFEQRTFVWESVTAPNFATKRLRSKQRRSFCITMNQKHSFYWHRLVHIIGTYCCTIICPTLLFKVQTAVSRLFSKLPVI